VTRIEKKRMKFRSDRFLTSVQYCKPRVTDYSDYPLASPVSETPFSTPGPNGSPTTLSGLPFPNGLRLLA